VTLGRCAQLLSFCSGVNFVLVREMAARLNGDKDLFSDLILDISQVQRCDITLLVQRGLALSWSGNNKCGAWSEMWVRNTNYVTIVGVFVLRINYDRRNGKSLFYFYFCIEYFIKPVQHEK
jgi:hypothetical protein